MFKKSKEKTIVTEADRLASKKEELDALSWERVAEIAKHLQEGAPEDEIKELSRELLSIARANTSLLEKFGVTSDSLTGKIMPSGIELVEKEPAVTEQKPTSFSSLRDAVLGENSQKPSPLSAIVAGETGSGMPDITKDVSDFFTSGEKERKEETPLIPRGDEAIRQSLQSKLATLPSAVSTEETAAEMPDIAQEDDAEIEAEDKSTLFNEVSLTGDEKAQEPDSGIDADAESELEGEVKSEVGALKPASVTVVGATSEDGLDQKDTAESALEPEQSSEPVRGFSFELKSLFAEKKAHEEEPAVEREIGLEPEIEVKPDQARDTSVLAAPEDEGEQLLEVEMQEEVEPSSDPEPELHEELKSELEDKPELGDEPKSEDKPESLVDQEEISGDTQSHEAVEEQQGELEEEAPVLPVEQMNESRDEQLPTIEELPIVEDKMPISEIPEVTSASQAVSEQVDLTPEIIISVVEQGGLDIEPEILQALIQEVSQEKETENEVFDAASDAVEAVKEPREEGQSPFTSLAEESAESLLSAATEPEQKEVFEAQQVDAVAPELSQSEDVKADQLPLQEQPEEQPKGRSLFGFGQLFQQAKRPEPEAPTPVEQPAPEAQASVAEEGTSKRRRKTTKQDLANFKLIYSSRDGALSLYRDADGHVVAVDNSKLE